MTKRLGFMAFTLAALVAVAPARAGTVTYTDLATFQSVTTGVTLETFNSGIQNGTPNNGFVFAPSGGNGLIAATGVRVDNTNGSDNISAAPASFTAIDPSYQASIFGEQSTVSGVSIFLPTGNFTAFSVDLGLYRLAAGDITITGTTSLGNAISGIVNYNGSTTLAFFGVSTTIANEYITSVTVRAQVPVAGQFQILDNVRFGTVNLNAAVPEPSSIALIGIGLIATGLPVLRRRMNKARA